MPLKKYFFEVKTLKSLSDVNSPHTLLKFEFLAENEGEAQEYRNSLIEHNRKYAPFVTIMVTDSDTELKSVHYPNPIIV